MPFVEEPPQSEPTPPVEDLFRQIQNQSDGAEPTITLEDLKRLDPSVTDIEILDIADELDIPKR